MAEAALREAKTAGGQVTKVADQSTIGSLAAQNTVFGVFEGLLVSVDTKDHYTRVALGGRHRLRPLPGR